MGHQHQRGSHTHCWQPRVLIQMYLVEWTRPSLVQSQSNYSLQEFTWQKCHAPSCNWEGREWRCLQKKNSIHFSGIIGAYNFCTISITISTSTTGEVPQDNIYSNDYQDGIEHNVRAAWTLTVPRKRGKKQKENRSFSFINIAGEEC